MEEYGVQVREEKRFAVLRVSKGLSGETVEAFADNIYLFTATVSRTGEIKVDNKTKIGQTVMDAFIAGKKIIIRKAT